MKKYELSITRNYVSSWGMEEAIREILQNAYDSEAQEKITFENNNISIKNYNIELPIKILLMGYGTKTSDDSKIGGFNEGSLLSLLVLTREGYDVSIYNGNKVWTPTLRELATLLKCDTRPVFEKLMILEEKGYIKTTVGKARSIVILKKVE